MSSSHAGAGAHQFGPGGHALAAGAAAAPAAAAALSSAQACLTMYGPGVVFKIDITFDPSSYPYHITGGTIKTGVCNAPHWTVNSGTIGNNVAMHATNNSPSTSCASTFDLVGNYQNPSSYHGTYGFNGSNNMFQQTSVFCGCGPCT